MGTIEMKIDKWKLHRFYSKNPVIAKYLPPTKPLTEQTLSSFMSKYKAVYIKATQVHTGRGVVKAWKSGRGYRFIKIKGKSEYSASIRKLYRRVNNSLRIRPIIVQKAIDLPPIKDRTFDIRVMMMRDAKRRWHYAGMVAKISGSGSIISNVRRGGGYVMTVEDALSKSLRFSKKRTESLKRKLIRVSRNIIRYSQKYPFYSYQCGIDLAVDKKGRVWIIEVNLHNPAHSLFKKLTDKKFYRRIRRLYKSYRNHNKQLI